MLKEEMDAAHERHPAVEYQPVLIDATYAGLISGGADVPLVIPSLNRDGDCLSDLVLPLFGSIAGAESVLLAFDEHYRTTVAMAEAPHGTAPALEGKDVANPLAMILACGALLRHAAERSEAAAELEGRGSAGTSSQSERVTRESERSSREPERASRAIYEAALETVGAGIRTPDLGGHSGTTEFTGAVVERVRTKLEVWAAL
jgi:isocitrate/isopropylmalate dehydrogenase